MLRCIIISIFTSICCAPALGLTFDKTPATHIVGTIQEVISEHYIPIADIGRAYDIGVFEMIEANPHVDPWAPEPGSAILIPSQFVLPSRPHTGIIINLAEMRLYYFHELEKKVSTFPVGIGKAGWSTPLAQTKILAKRKHPYWHVPQSIRAGHAKNGRLLPTVIPPGPTNPLGEYAFYLGLSGYLIHGTIHPGGIGMRSTHGCIRMYPADIEWLFQNVPVNTPVRIVHEPLKIALQEGEIILEAHLPIRDPHYKGSNSMDTLVALLEKHIGKAVPEVRWDKVKYLLKSGSGIPEIIGRTR